MSRVELALKACEGLSDEQLAERGKASFLGMILRKRAYATSARALFAQNQAYKAEILRLRQTIAELEANNAPITDTSEARELLKGIFK